MRRQGPRSIPQCLLGIICIFSSFQRCQADVMGKVGGHRSLVLLDNLEVRETHSEYFDSLKDRGHQLTFSLADAADVALLKYGEYLYDNLLLFAPTTEEFANLDVAAISNFVEAGGNLLVAVDSDVSDLMRDIAGDFGVDFDKKRSRVIDHFLHELSLDKTFQHTAILSSEMSNNTVILGDFAKSPQPVIFEGIGHAVDDANILALKILTGASSSYSAMVGKDASSSLQNVGKDTLLVTAIQARNNARAIFAGSLSLFSNEFFAAALTSTRKVMSDAFLCRASISTKAKKFDVRQPAGNRAFATELSKWGFGERGILRASNVSHSRADGYEALI